MLDVRYWYDIMIIISGTLNSGLKVKNKSLANDIKYNKAGKYVI